MVIDLFIGAAVLAVGVIAGSLAWIAISLHRKARCCVGDTGATGAQGPRGLPGTIDEERVRQIVIDEIARQP